MKEWRELPEMGIGLVYMSGLHGLVARAGAAIDFIEVEPQQHWFSHGAESGGLRLDDRAFLELQKLSDHFVIHSVGCPIGATDPGLEAQRGALGESVMRLDPPWLSEHLSFDRFEIGNTSVHAGFLLPPIQSRDTVAIAAQNLRRLREVTGRPVAFETGVNYLQPWPGEMRDGEFFAAVAEQAGCGIVLDLHNLYANACNGRDSIDDVVAALPLDRVIEVHLAGGEWLRGYWLDAHSQLVPEALWRQACLIVARLPNLKAITFEIMDEALVGKGVTEAAVHKQLERMRALWSLRGSALPRNATGVADVAARYATCASTTTPNASSSIPVSLPGRDVDARRRPVVDLRECVSVPSPATWETALGRLAIGGAPSTPLEYALANDPGVAIVQTLVHAVRSGTLIDALPLSSRLLQLAIGADGVRELIDTYLSGVAPLPYATDEAIRYAEWLRAEQLPIDTLDDVLGFEIACCRAVAAGGRESSTWRHDPDAVLGALLERRLPRVLPLPSAVTIDVTA